MEDETREKMEAKLIRPRILEHEIMFHVEYWTQVQGSSDSGGGQGLIVAWEVHTANNTARRVKEVPIFAKWYRSKEVKEK